MGEAVATLVSISTAPVPVCVLSVAVLRERLTGAIDGALASALIGKVLLIGVGRQGTARQVSSSAGGILLSLGAAFNFDVFILVSRLLANRYHPLPSITIAVSIGALLVMTVAGVSAGITVRYSAATWALFLYLGLVPTALGHALCYQGVQNATASEASVASLVEPLTSMALAVVILGERLGALGLLGAALLISAIVFLYRNGPARSAAEILPVPEQGK